LDADIDHRAEVEHSRAIQQRPDPWRETWDVEYFQKALEEIYAVSEFDKFTKAEGSGVQ